MTDYVFSDLGEDAEEKPAIDHARIAAAVREILFAVGEDPDREGLQETPARSPGRMRRSSPDSTTTRPRSSP